MTEWLQSAVFWHWWVLGVILLVLEVLAPTTLFLWPAVGAGVVGLLLLLMPGLDWHLQWLIFAAVSVIAVAVGRAYLRKRPIATDRPRLNRRGEQYVGRVLTLSEPIVNGVGFVRVDDTRWRIEVAGADLPAEAKVQVVGVDGSTLRVEAVP